MHMRYVSVTTGGPETTATGNASLTVDTAPSRAGAAAGQRRRQLATGCKPERGPNGGDAVREARHRRAHRSGAAARWLPSASLVRDRRRDQHPGRGRGACGRAGARFERLARGQGPGARPSSGASAARGDGSARP